MISYSSFFKDIISNFKINNYYINKTLVSNLTVNRKTFLLKEGEGSFIFFTGTKSNFEEVKEYCVENNINILLLKPKKVIYGEVKTIQYITLNLSELLLGKIEQPISNNYARGKAPLIYWRWSSPRCSGNNKLRNEINNNALLLNIDLNEIYPYEDDNHRRWISAEKVCYLELVISVKDNWKEVDLLELTKLIKGE